MQIGHLSKNYLCVRCANGRELFFFYLNSFFISFSSVRQIFMSIFAGKFILPRSQKYFRGSLYTYFLSICRPNFPILSSRLSSVLCMSLSELWILLSWLGMETTGFLVNKRPFSIIFNASFSNVLAWYPNTCKFPVV